MKTVVCDGPAWNTSMPTQFIWLPLTDGTELKCAHKQEVEYDRIQDAEPWIAAGLLTAKPTAPAPRATPPAAPTEKKDE